ncbi:MAG: hypothetical protein JNL88_13290 [Bacteroidia bacterium]|nr:hypothetical protein [Bacteroidia bacterium]
MRGISNEAARRSNKIIFTFVMMISEKMRAYENMHIVMWLLKDTCWVLDFKIPGLIMIFPTIGVALHITWLHRKALAELYHNLAVVSWICANSVWMIGEFFYEDTLRPVSTIFFVLGLLMVFIYYFIHLPRNRTAK